MKKKKVPRAVEAKQQPPKLNPFELKSSRKKFDVLGKRDRQAKRNVIKSREEAVNKVCLAMPLHKKTSSNQTAAALLAEQHSDSMACLRDY